MAKCNGGALKMGPWVHFCIGPLQNLIDAARPVDSANNPELRTKIAKLKNARNTTATTTKNTMN